MPLIELETFVRAPIERCFDLSRSIDLHRLGFVHTNEEAIGGRTSGMMELNETVTWRATHFGVRQQLTVQIDRFEPPFFFRDVMLKGAFRRFQHEHIFVTRDEGCLMRDRFNYESPFGVLGKIADLMVLENYMKRLLETRNSLIKKVAESDDWRKVLG